jgi:hypothetical protein
MDLTSEHFDLAEELMEYIKKGDGTYFINSGDTKCDIISVTASIVRDNDGTVYFASSDEEDGMMQFYADLNFIFNDESKGAIQISFSPISVMTTNIKAVKLNDEDELIDTLREVKSELKHSNTFTSENLFMWSKCLANYISSGSGTHNPNFVDSTLGMTAVYVKWGDINTLFNIGDDDSLLYYCQVTYISTDGTGGSVVFQAMPYQISFFN